MAPTVVYTLLFFGYPILLLFYNSFKTLSVVRGLDEFVGLKNYVQLLITGSPLIPSTPWAIVRTLIYTFAAVAASFLLGLGYAFLVNALIAKSEKMGSVVKYIILIPMLVMPVAAAEMWFFMYNESHGWINFIIEALGFKRASWTAVPETALWSVIITDIWGWSPYMFLILLAGLQDLPSDPLEAADVDGASILQKIRYVTLPMMRGIISIAIILKTIDTYQAFAYLYVMTKGGPGEASMTLNIMAYLLAFVQFHLGLGSALGVVTLLVILLITVILLAIRRRTE